MPCIRRCLVEKFMTVYSNYIIFIKKSEKMYIAFLGLQRIIHICNENIYNYKGETK